MKGIIFDMDGTMIDNMMVHHRIWQIFLKEMGLEMTLEEVQEQIHGVNVEIMERLFGDRYTPEERIRLSDQKEATYRRLYASEIELLDGLPAFLREIHAAGIPMGIGTAAPKENVDFVLDALDLRRFFKVALHSGDVQQGKPHPEIFLKVAAGLDLDPQDCVVFEDSPTGAKAALNAGSQVVVVTTTHNREEFDLTDKVLRYIKDFTEIELNDLNTITSV